MPKTLWTAVAVGLLALGAASCGGGSDIAGDVCNKANTCKSLSGTTVAQCKNMFDESLQSKPSAAQSDLNACLGKADCTSFNECINNWLEGGSGGGSTGSGGSMTGNTGGSSGGGSGGSPVSGSGGSSVGGSGGSSGGGSGGSSGSGSGGSSGGSGGSSVAGGGGSGTGGTAGGGGSGTGGLRMGGATGSGGTTGTTSSGGSGAGGSGVGGATGGANSSGGNQTGGTQGTGGSAAGGTGGSSSTGPSLVTSAQDAYWQTGTVTNVTSGTADVNVDKNTTYQRWDGFGGCFNEMGWDALSVVSTDDVTNAMKLLFDPSGANFIYGRLPMGASDYAMSKYTLDDLPSGTANDYNMDKFSIARDQQKLIPFIQAALKVRPDIHLWASPWYVPAWMKDSGSNMKTDAQTLGAHALYMARFVEEYAKLGLKIEAIHPQNEPGYSGDVHWTQAGLITFMKTYLGPTLAQRNLTTQVWCGTMSKADNGGYDQAIALATAADADAMKVVKGFGVQWNLHDAVATLAQKGPVMQTEHRCGNYNFASPYWDQSRYSSSKPQNDHLYGEESWQIIRDWIVAGVNSYSAWNMVLDTFGKNLDPSPWPQNALLVVDRSAKKLIVTPAYYVFRHFSYYIAVGATRVGATAGTDAYKGANTTMYGSKKVAYDGVNAFAFKNPDGSVVVQLYNKNAAAATTTVGVGSALSQTLYQFSVPAHGWATLRTTP